VLEDSDMFLESLSAHAGALRLESMGLHVASAFFLQVRRKTLPLSLELCFSLAHLSQEVLNGLRPEALFQQAVCGHGLAGVLSESA